MKAFALVIAMAFLAMLSCSSPMQGTSSPATTQGEGAGSLFHDPALQSETVRGHQVIQELSSLSKQQMDQFDITKYRGEHVAFEGSAAPPGATNDLVTEDDFYLRVVNRKNRDLRPQAAVWSVEVRGTILQVLPENKIIVLSVEDGEWRVEMTG